jgi:hypothetical protein
MMTQDYEGEYIAVCGCGNVLRCVRPKDVSCRCGNNIAAGMFDHEDEKPYVIVTGFRGEKIKCYQQ